MKNCPNCHAENPDEAGFCASCGAPMNGQPAYQPYVEPTVSPFDHTKDYEPEDISQNKVLAMASYLLGLPGILLALLAARDSKYNLFQVHQALKIAVLEVLMGLFTVVLCWTVVVPAVCGILLLLLLIIRIIAFIQVCQGKVMEVWLIRKLKFLQ